MPVEASYAEIKHRAARDPVLRTFVYSLIVQPKDLACAVEAYM